MREKLDGNNKFLRKIMFSEEATFHVPGKVNKQNVRIVGSQNPHARREHIRERTKDNVWCGYTIV
jgi:translation initiation factor IF-1